jgi:hypothetical protein
LENRHYILAYGCLSSFSDGASLVLGSALTAFVAGRVALLDTILCHSIISHQFVAMARINKTSQSFVMMHFAQEFLKEFRLTNTVNILR